MSIKPVHLLLILVVVVAIQWVFVLRGGLYFFHEAYPQRLSKEFFFKEQKDYQTLILGDSKGFAAINPEYFPDAVSLALLGTGPVEAHFMLTNYLKAHRPPKTIIYSMSPIRFSISENFWVSTANLKMLDFQEARSFIERANQLNSFEFSGESSLLGYRGSLVYLKMIYAGFPLLYIPNISYASVFLEYRHNQLILEESMRRSGFFSLYRRKSNVRGLGREANLTNFSTNAALVSYFEETLELARKHDIIVHFVAAPTHPDSWGTNSEKYYRDFVEFLEGYHRFYSGFSVTVPPHMGNLSEFADKDHIDEVAAKIFSMELARQISVSPTLSAPKGRSSYFEP